MRAKVETRLEKLEAHAAPFVERARERRREVEKLRAYIQPDLDEIMTLAVYCGLPSLIELRAEIESDWIEQELLIVAEYKELFGDAERTEERMCEAIIKSDTRFYREIYGREFSPADITSSGSLGDKVREDIRAGIPASESEAARQVIKNEATRSTRLKKHTDDYAAFIAGLDSRIPDIVFNDEP